MRHAASKAMPKTGFWTRLADVIDSLRVPHNRNAMPSISCEKRKEISPELFAAANQTCHAIERGAAERPLPDAEPLSAWISGWLNVDPRDVPRGLAHRRCRSSDLADRCFNSATENRRHHVDEPNPSAVQARDHGGTADTPGTGNIPRSPAPFVSQRPRMK